MHSHPSVSITVTGLSVHICDLACRRSVEITADLMLQGVITGSTATKGLATNDFLIREVRKATVCAAVAEDDLPDL